MSEKEKLMDELVDRVSSRVIEIIRSQGTVTAAVSNDDQECKSSYECEASTFTCTSNEFGCNNFACENDFAG